MGLQFCSEHSHRESIQESSGPSDLSPRECGPAGTHLEVWSLPELQGCKMKTQIKSTPSCLLVLGFHDIDNYIFWHTAKLISMLKREHLRTFSKHVGQPFKHRIAQGRIVIHRTTQPLIGTSYVRHPTICSAYLSKYVHLSHSPSTYYHPHFTGEETASGR